MTDKRTSHRHLRLGLGTFALFALTVALTAVATLPNGGMAALWPCNALVLGIMVARVRTRGEIRVISAAGMLASFATHVLRQTPVEFAALFTLANLIEWSLSYHLLRLLWRRGELVDSLGNIVALATATAGALTVSAPLGALGVMLARGMAFGAGLQGWALSGMLSQMIVTPAVVIAAQVASGQRVHGVHGKTLLEVFAVLSLVATVTTAVFCVFKLPLTFLVAPFVLLATFRFRAAGAVAAVAIVAAVAGAATVNGMGAIAYLVPKPAEQVLMLQLFLAGLLIPSLPVAAMLTERDIHAEEARVVADHFRSVVENIGEVIFRIDGKGRWAYLNPAWEELAGDPAGRAIGRDWTERFAAEDQPGLTEHFASVLGGDRRDLRRVLRLDTGQGYRWVELFMQGLRGQDGDVTGATGTLRDIDDRKRLEENVMTAKRRAEQRAREATLLASTDELTGIANRRAFLGQLEREIAGAAEFGWPLAVAIFDVDHFKSVNDRYGHATGDRVLQLIAMRAAVVVRGGDLVGRLGGEEFGILMPGAASEDAAQVSERLRQAMESLDTENGALPSVTVSVGIAARQGQADAATLLAQADAALYAAKEAGRNRVQIAA